MVEKMTAVWLIILTMIVCAAVPGMLIYITTIPHKTAQAAAKLLLFPIVDDNLSTLHLSTY
jgi:hypothetical protein